MSDIAIRVDGLGKQYRIGRRDRYKTLRDTLTDTATAPFRWARSFVTPSPSVNIETQAALFWALKDVSFEVPRGAVVGVIGRNGAGKSTLLKVLSRITEPSEGRVEIHGRVGSLLEVGTGFHPELTGRENVFLNGAILGMRRAEITRKFDEIVAFAELDKFIDTPVKHYSSGMYMRLAFAVAAHLEPEILIVDEVLAVGDAQFQKKCLGKMGAVAREGRTVVFVSHQMNQIRRLCDSCIWLEGGRTRETGKTVDVVSAYDSVISTITDGSSRPIENASTSARFLKWELAGAQRGKAHHLDTLGQLTVSFTLDVTKAISHVYHGISLFSGDRQLIWGTATDGLVFTPGQHDMTYRLPSLPLRPGNYCWQVSLFREGDLLDIWDCSPELVVATIPLTHPRDDWSGLLNIPYTLSQQALLNQV